MKKLNCLVFAVFYISIVMISSSQIVSGQDPVIVAPENYKVLYEDETVRILEFNDKAGDKIQRHSHPNYFVYVVSKATRTFITGGTGRDCEGKDRTEQIVKLTADEKIPSDGTLKPPVTHCEVNSGDTPTRLIVIEFKPSKIKTKTTTTIPTNQPE